MVTPLGPYSNQSKRKFAILCESNLLDGSNVSDQDIAAEILSINDVKDRFEQAEYVNVATPNLHREYGAERNWRGLAALNVEVLWFETHGSVNQGVRVINMEQVARMSTELLRDWGLLGPRLFVFGSCYTAASELPGLMGRLIEREHAVAIWSNDEVKYTDGLVHYPKIIDAWLQVRDLDPAIQVQELTRLLPAPFSAGLIDGVQ